MTVRVRMRCDRKQRTTVRDLSVPGMTRKFPPRTHPVTLSRDHEESDHEFALTRVNAAITINTRLERAPLTSNMERPRKVSKGSSGDGSSKRSSKSRGPSEQVHTEPPQHSRPVLLHSLSPHLRSPRIQVNARLRREKSRIVMKAQQKPKNLHPKR